MSKHTPGPWTFFINKLGGHVNGGGKRIARVHITKDRMFVSEPEANARLIAAAPDLLAACKESEMLAAHGMGAINISNDPDCKANTDRNIAECIRIQNIVRAAIAKAEGSTT